MIMEERHKEMVLKVLKKYPYNFFAFGSRVKDKPHKFSDLDICFFEPILFNVQSHIDEDFEESDLPFTVDLVDWNMTGDDFKQDIKNDLICIQKTDAYPEIQTLIDEYIKK